MMKYLKELGFSTDGNKRWKEMENLINVQFTKELYLRREKDDEEDKDTGVKKNIYFMGPRAYCKNIFLASVYMFPCYEVFINWFIYICCIYSGSG